MASWLRRQTTPNDVRDPRVAAIDGRAEISIETAPASGSFDDAGTYSWRDYKRLIRTGEDHPRQRAPVPGPAGPRVDEAILGEIHHRQYGRPWALGKYIFEFVLARGLEPHHRLLDVGCGALRFGIRAIDYLDAGRYCGIDAHLKSLEAAVTYEIPLHALEAKQPRLLWNADFAFEHFGGTFDWALDFYTSAHVPEDQVETVFTRAAAVLKPGAKLLVCPRPALPDSTLGQLGLALSHEEVQECPLLAGHPFSATNAWLEYERS
jgi:SAM-dependent methyltransferase